MSSATAPRLPGAAPELDDQTAGQAGPRLLDAVVDMSEYLKGITNPKALTNQKDLIAAYDAAVNALVGPNDVQVAKKRDRDGKRREFKKKSAWKKLARHFRIDVYEKSHHVTRTEDGDTIAEVIMLAVAPWGQRVEEIGACTTYEERFRYDKSKGWHDCLATAQTRASNRAISALIAAGEVSAEEAEAQAEQPEMADDTFPFGELKGRAVTDEAIGLELLVSAIDWAGKDEQRRARFAALLAAAWEAVPQKIATCPDDELRKVHRWASKPSRADAFQRLADECAAAIEARGLDHPVATSAEGNAMASASADSSAGAGAATDASHSDEEAPLSEAARLHGLRNRVAALLLDPSVASVREDLTARLPTMTEPQLVGEIDVLQDVIAANRAAEKKREQGRKGLAARHANAARDIREPDTASGEAGVL